MKKKSLRKKQTFDSNNSLLHAGACQTKPSHIFYAICVYEYELKGFLHLYEQCDKCNSTCIQSGEFFSSTQQAMWLSREKWRYDFSSIVILNRTIQTIQFDLIIKFYQQMMFNDLQNTYSDVLHSKRGRDGEREREKEISHLTLPISTGISSCFVVH